MATAPQDNVGQSKFGPGDRATDTFRYLPEAVEPRLKSVLQRFLQHHSDDATNEKTKERAAKCSCEARIWYYRILENLISHERKRLGISNISGILENDQLQCSLVACCLEIAVTTNQLPCDFPLLLQIIKLTPHPFWKVIEPVLRVAVGLPHAVIRHLGQVEERVLESLAWTSDSPLWGDIRANEGRLPACQEVMLPAQLEEYDHNILGVDVSSGADLSADQQRSAINRAERSSSLYLFARNVYSLMGRRLRELCSVLDIPDELRLRIWTCFEYSLIHCTHLMRDRHLDQLLMCAIYIMAKITKVEIPFKRIMERYKSQPHANKSVCKNVLISEVENSPNANADHSGAIPTPNTPSTHYPGPCQEQRGNLIYFYNQIYTTKMQHFAEQFASTSVGDTPLSPYPRQQKASPHRRRLSNSVPVYVSSYNTETPAPQTPTLCYYFNSSQSERLREINNMIKTGLSPSRRCYTVSEDVENEKEEEEEEEGEDGRPAKRLRLDSQSAWQRRLRNVVNERVPRRHQDHVRPFPVTKPNLH